MQLLGMATVEVPLFVVNNYIGYTLIGAVDVGECQILVGVACKGAVFVYCKAQVQIRVATFYGDCDLLLFRNLQILTPRPIYTLLE